MAINPDYLLNYKIPDVDQTYGWRECVLYGLGVGAGMDPLDEQQLKFVDETKLQALPTMANILGHPGMWMQNPDVGLDWTKMVHGEQSMQIHRPLAAAGHVIGRNRVVHLSDKGAGRGALVYVERTISDAETGQAIATLLQTLFCRADGGFGGDAAPYRTSRAVPTETPDCTIQSKTSPQTALIYRLTGDINPLHSNPAMAIRAGFPRPILHGLSTFGIAGRALVAGACGNDPTRLRDMSCRFSEPVFPGETIDVDIWRIDDRQVAFHARVADRGAVVLANGRATLA